MNPTPQPHADDVKVAEAKWLERVSEQLCDDKFGEMDDEDIPSAVAKIFNDDPPPELRLSNEALREMVKELELACLNLNNDLTGQGAYINIIRDKLTAASKIITKCEGALQAAIKPLSEIADIDSETRAGWGHKAVDEALQHIAKWKQP